jgi:polyphosphate kinase 2 (PPK2 family)
MYLQVSFQNGDSRLIRLHSDFFAFNREPSIEEKVKSMLSDMGKNPYKVFLQENDEVIIDRVYNENAPVKIVEQVITAKTKRKRFEQVKELKKSFLNRTFEHRIVFGLDGVKSFSLSMA